MSAPLRILFTGDVSFTGVYEGPVVRGEEIFDDEIRRQFAEHDYTVINLEGPATSAEQIRRLDQRVVSPPNAVDYLADHGVNVFNLGNNHIVDCELAGLRDTTGAIDRRDCQRFGAGMNADEAREPLYLSQGGVTVALIGVCGFRSTAAGIATPYGTFYDASADDVRKLVNEARQKADYVVLNYHAGEEYTAVPMPSRRRLLHQYAEMGIDAIVAHHSHTVQGHECHANCEIFYSLGNFAFDVYILRIRPLTEKGAMLSLQFEDAGIKFEYIPIECDWANGQVKAGAPEFLQHIAANSDFANYRQLWRRDAYRTYFKRRRPLASDTSSPTTMATARKSKLRHILSPTFYWRLYRQFRNDTVRPVMLAAFQEAIRGLPARLRKR